ncbi:Rap guanine nucleotide exchange factor [Ceratobasidium theobromae]|uniref:Rap guanine nucleotide exchange factor n=1 Tax=Ceratobasidium theobromae TaxID=1582974 RepID=A0A5N5QGR1_9AGAM|nr:Rap guanine nucleotide exchange factor [Ceratobasidium theobromae]
MNQCGPTELLELAFTAAHDINRRSQDVTIHRRQCVQLSRRCSELVNTLREDEERSPDDTKLREAVDELEEVLLKIRKKVTEWANLNRVKSFMREDQISSDIDAFNKLLDTHALKFQVGATELHRQQRKIDLYRQQDHEEVKEMLHKIIRNVENLSAVMGDDVPALMETIQEELNYEQPDTGTYLALGDGYRLDTLHTKTGILPLLMNLSGQVSKLGEPPLADGGMADIYKDRWVGDEKIMLRAIRHVKSESAIKGSDYATRWISGVDSSIVTYSVFTGLLSEAALGLKYLHGFELTIIHGDLRAANVLVSAGGEALLADFGLSKIVAEEEGAAAAPTSLEKAGSSRWMAPELFQVDTSTSASVTCSSDVWSFGMLCLEVLTGCPPFFPKLRVDAQVIATLIQGCLPERPEPLEQMHGRGLSDEMWEVMNRCWSRKPAERPEMRTLASEVQALHVGYLEQYGVTSIRKLVWGSVMNLVPTNLVTSPPFSSIAGSSISSMSSSAEPNPHGHSVIKYDDEGNVLMGNLEGLVGQLLRITPAVQMDNNYRECFLTVYRGFAKVDDLWRILADQYRRQYIKPGTQKKEQKVSIRTFMDVNWSDGPLEPEQAKLEKTVEEHMGVLDQVPQVLPPAGGWRIKLSDLDPLVVARQLMKLESELFQKILASDIAAWLKNIVDEHIVSIRRFLQSNYRIEDWCLSLILSTDSSEIEKRALIITFLRLIAEECLQIRAFSCAHAIMSALTHDYIGGLEYTWRLVEKRVKESLKQMSLLLSDEDKYKAKVNSEPQSTCVPILRIHLRDLSRSYSEMQTWIRHEGEDLVNFQKFTEIWKSIKEFTKYQAPKCTISHDPVTAMYLEYNFARLDANTTLQEQLKVRSEGLRRKENQDFNNRRLGIEDAGIRPRKKR